MYNKDKDPEDEGKPSKLPITLSAFVFPGAGQFAQKRWVPGALFALVFALSFGFLMVCIFVPLYHNLMAALDLAESGNAEEFKPISLIAIALTFLFGVATYIGSLVDTTAAYRRAIVEWQRAKRDLPRETDTV